MKDPFLKIEHLSKSFSETKVLNDISVNIPEGAFTCILGPSGSGKTTLLMILAGLESATEGKISFRGEDITELAIEKRRIGIVFQHYALFPNLTVENNILYGLSRKVSAKEKKEKLERLVTLTHLEALEKRFPQELSGGQQQRVAIARALAIEPKFLLLDEPLSALDPTNRANLGRELRDIQQKAGITTVMVTHDRNEALALSDFIVILNHGEIEQADTPSRLYDQPATPFVATFVGGMNLFQSEKINDGQLTGVRYADIEVMQATEKALSQEETFTAELLSQEFTGDFIIARFLLNDFETEVTAQIPRTNPVADSLTVGKLYAVRIPSARSCSWGESA